MTTQSFKKKMSILLLLAGLFTLQSFAVAGGEKDPVKKVGITANVRYMGIQDDQLLFSVQFEKENAESRKQTEIKILANGDTEIFGDYYRNNRAQLLFKINLNNIEQVAFEISNNGETIHYRFDVKATYKAEINVVAAQQAGQR